jgi:chromate reductase
MRDIAQIRLLGVSGSLREASTNTRLLMAATHLAPPRVCIHVSTLVAGLRPFNPETSPEDCPAVDQWIREVRSSDGIIVSTPEYARGYPGQLKNAFDWLVSTDAYVNKPFMLLNASARSTVAQRTFTTVLETMSGVHIEAASTTVPLLGTNPSVAHILDNPTFAARIRESLCTFIGEVRKFVTAGAEAAEGR